MKFIKALNDNLRLEGETLGQFAAEIKKLTDQDKADLKAYFAAEGITIED